MKTPPEPVSNRKVAEAVLWVLNRLGTNPDYNSEVCEEKLKELGYAPNYHTATSPPYHASLEKL